MQNISDVHFFIDKEKTVNFLAFAYTPWHSYGVNAVAEMLREHKVKIQGVVCICKHSQAGWMLDESFFKEISEFIEVIKISNESVCGKRKRIFEYFRVLFAPEQMWEQDFYLIMPNEVDPMEYGAIKAIRKECNIVNLVIDEGLATYMRKPGDFYKSEIHKQERFLRKMWVYSRIYILDRLFLKKINVKGYYRDFFLLHKEGNKLGVKQSSLKYYKTIFSKKLEAVDGTAFEQYGEAIVINTQPFWDENKITDNADLKILFAVCKELTKLGERIILKPHPREKCLSRYGQLSKCVFIDDRNAIPQEEIFCSLKKLPKALIGFSSTTLVSAQLFFNIKTFSIIKLLNSSNINPNLKNERQRFLDTFEGVIKCPSDIEQLIAEIEK